MLDIGSWELMLIIMLGIVVIGPKELPGVIRSVGHWVRRAKDLAREFQGGLEEIARETEIDKFKDDLESELGDANLIGGEIKDAADPDGEFAAAFDYEDGDWYGDRQDDAEDGDPTEAPAAETPADAESANASDAPAEASPDDAMDTDVKTGP